MRNWLLGLFALLVFAAPAAAETTTFTAELRSEEFTQWPGPPIRLWTYRPQAAGAGAPVVFIMHGAGRDADWVAKVWAPYAEARGFIVVAPEYSRAAFPSRNYILGPLSDENNEPLPRERWSFSSIEPIFDYIVAREGLTARSYKIFGHSAGGQFVHRFVLFGAGPRMERAIAANAGWYTMPRDDVSWPYGLRRANGVAPPAQYFAAPMIVLLGDRDIDPNDEALAREREAMAQGPHRFARGKLFFAAANKEAKKTRATLAWACRIAPTLAHDNQFVAAFAAPLLFDGAANSESDCQTLPVPQPLMPLGGPRPPAPPQTAP